MHRIFALGLLLGRLARRIEHLLELVGDLLVRSHIGFHVENSDAVFVFLVFLFFVVVDALVLAFKILEIEIVVWVVLGSGRLGGFEVQVVVAQVHRPLLVGLLVIFLESLVKLGH